MSEARDLYGKVTMARQNKSLCCFELLIVYHRSAHADHTVLFSGASGERSIVSRVLQAF